MGGRAAGVGLGLGLLGMLGASPAQAQSNSGDVEAYSCLSSTGVTTTGGIAGLVYLIARPADPPPRPVERQPPPPLQPPGTGNPPVYAPPPGNAAPPPEYNNIPPPPPPPPTAALFLRQQALPLAHDLAVGHGPALDLLADAVRVPAAHRARLQAGLRAHRAALQALAQPVGLDAGGEARAQAFVRAYVDVLREDAVLRADLEAFLAAQDRLVRS